MARKKKNGAEKFLGTWARVYNPRPNQPDPRRYLERLEGGIIAEDKNAMANLPQEGFQTKFPSDPRKHAMMHIDIEVE